MKKPIEIFGILNLTPDSFSDGGKYLKPEVALKRAAALFESGATFVDVGAESTRPEAETVTLDEEWCRLEGVLKILLVKYPGKISLDSRNPETVEKYLRLGGTMINDVSGFQNVKMRRLAADFDAWCIVNHFPGQTVQAVHEQQIDSEIRVLEDLQNRAEQLIGIGVDPKKIILDPGVGFGKTAELNKKLLGFAALSPDMKVLIGHSKKRFLGEGRMEKKINQEAANQARQTGSWALRVHDPEWY